MHRLAKSDGLAAVATGDRFCRLLDGPVSVRAIEREYSRSLRIATLRSMAARFSAFVGAASPVRTEVAQGL